MSNKWPLVGLGELIVHRNEFIIIQDDAKYKRCRVQVHAQGIVLRDEVTGFEIRTKKQQVCRTNDFLVAEIDAKVGGYGIIPTYLDGAIVSSHYFLYKIDQKKMLTKYLEFFTKTKYFQNQVLAQGSTNYAAIRPGHVLNYNIPLPSLPEQRKIVTRIEKISQKLSEINMLQEVTQKEINVLMDLKLKHVLEKAFGWKSASISDFVTINPTRARSNFKVDETVSFVPMSAVDGVTGIIKEKITKSFYQVSKGYTYFEDGDVIFAKITPCMQNGKSAIAENLENGIGFGSTEFHVLRPGPEIKAEWLHIIVRSKEFRKDASTYFKGTAGQQRVPNSFLETKIITVPPLPEQEKLIKYFKDFKEKLNQLGQIQSKLKKEIKFLMPLILDKAFKGKL